MAKLNIDFAVNLGNSVGEINKVVTALTNLNLQVNDLAKNLSSLSNKKIAPKVEAEIKLKETSIAPMKVKVDAELPKGPLGNVFDRYIQGATNAKTVTEFLKEEEKRLTAEIKNLQQVAGNTTSLVKYTSALKQIGEKSKQLSAIKLADPFNKLSASANQANLTLVNVGRVAQDLPFGFLGIANNLNPLVESFKALKDEAKLAGTSVKSQLLASLKGFGGVGLAISAVSAALSFASVGLQYWNRNTKEGKKTTDELAESTKNYKESLKSITSDISQDAARISVLVTAFKEQNLSLLQRKSVIEELQRISPEYFSKLSSEKTTVDQLTAAYNNYNNNVLKSITLQANKKRLEETITKILELQEKSAGLDLPPSEVTINPKASKNKIKEYGTNIEVGLNDSLSKAFDKPRTINIRNVRFEGDGEFLSKEEQSFAIREGITNLTKDEVKETKKLVELRDRLLKTVGKQEFIVPVEDKKNQLDKTKTKAEKLSDAFKEIIDDLLKISNLPGLSSAERITLQVERIKKGFDEVLDIDAAANLDKRFKVLQGTLSNLVPKKLFNDLLKIGGAIEPQLQRLRAEAILFKKSTVDEQIKVVEDGIGKLYNEFNKNPLKSPSYLAAFFATVNGLAGVLDTLRLQKLREDIDAINDKLKNTFTQIETRGSIFNKFTTTEKIDAAKRSLDDLIDLLDEAKKSGNIQLQIETQGNIDEKIRQIDGLIKQGGKEREIVFARLSVFGFDVESKAKREISNLRKRLEEELSKQFPDMFEVGALKAKLDVAIDASNSEDAAKKAGERAGEAFAQFAADGIASIGELVGAALSGSDDRDFVLNLAKNLGESLKSFGKQIIIASDLITKAKLLFGTGPAGIAAGFALIALGTAIANTAQAKLEKRASGGYISGPGSGTSDSIPARLSNGEYVIKARSVSKYGVGFLNAVNSGSLKKFATGGMVSSITVPKFSSPNVVISEQMGQQVPYIATTQIKGQDLRLVLQRADSRYNRVV